MARLTTAQRVDRVMRLLLALRKRSVATALGNHGFGAGDIDEAFGHLRALTVANLDGVARTSDTASHRERVSAWSKHWQPILEPALQRRFPAIARQLFPHFDFESQVRDRSYAIAKMFVDGYDQLRAGPQTDEVRDALALLAKKGLHDRALAEVREATELEPPGGEWPGADFTAAEKRLWDWYIEWSAVVRARIRDKRLRRELGISESRDDEDSA